MECFPNWVHHHLQYEDRNREVLCGSIFSTGLLVRDSPVSFHYQLQAMLSSQCYRGLHCVDCTSITNPCTHARMYPPTNFLTSPHPHPTPLSHTHTRAHVHARARTHTRTHRERHIHTHACAHTYTTCIAKDLALLQIASCALGQSSPLVYQRTHARTRTHARARTHPVT